MNQTNSYIPVSKWLRKIKFNRNILNFIASMAKINNDIDFILQEYRKRFPNTPEPPKEFFFNYDLDDKELY